MRTPFGHPKVSRLVWFDVPEPLPPTYRIPFPPEVSIDEPLVDINQPFVAMNNTPIRIAEFRLGKVIIDLNHDGIMGYWFYRWV